jgi:hypothetical protein
METFKPTLFFAAIGGIVGIIVGRILKLEGFLESIACFLAGTLISYFGYEILSRKKKDKRE